jgi:hypothetical protein
VCSSILILLGGGNLEVTPSPGLVDHDALFPRASMQRQDHTGIQSNCLDMVWIKSDMFHATR